jgi:hypothetical protein
MGMAAEQGYGRSQPGEKDESGFQPAAAAGVGEERLVRSHAAAVAAAEQTAAEPVTRRIADRRGKPVQSGFRHGMLRPGVSRQGALRNAC